MDIRPIDAMSLAIRVREYAGKTHCNGHIELANGILKSLAMIDSQPVISLNTLRDEIYEDAVAHGLWDWAMAHEHLPDLRDSCVDLIRGEVCELEIECGSEERYAEELADIIIVSMSVAGKLDIDIDAAIKRKMEKNKARPWKHGKE